MHEADEETLGSRFVVVEYQSADDQKNRDVEKDQGRDQHGADCNRRAAANQAVFFASAGAGG